MIRVCGYHRAPQDWRGLVRCNDGAQLELTSLKFLKLLDDDQVSSHMVKKTHTAVRSVEQAAYVILMPTLTPHDASSDRASHRYFHLSQWVE